MKGIRVLFLSNWFGNPYKKVLAQNLQDNGVYVEEKRISQFFLINALKMRDLDILHFHEIPIPLTWRNHIAQLIKLTSFMIQIFILRCLGTKIVWTIHEWDQKLSSRKVSFNPFYAKVFGRCFDAFITHCETSMKTLTNELGSENRFKSFTIYHGNYIDWYKNEISSMASREILGISNDDIIFLLFGEIYQYKGILEAIETFKQIQEDNTLLLISGRANCVELEDNIWSKIQGTRNIKFIPRRIPDNDVQIYMNASNYVLVPYKVFTTSGVAILAMSFGKACIAPKVGFFDDLLDNSGAFLYNPDDKDGLLQAMEDALANKNKIVEMGEYNKRKAEQWSWQYVVTETLKVYDSCLNSR